MTTKHFINILKATNNIENFKNGLQYANENNKKIMDYTIYFDDYTLTITYHIFKKEIIKAEKFILKTREKTYV